MTKTVSQVTEASANQAATMLSSLYGMDLLQWQMKGIDGAISVYAIYGRFCQTIKSLTRDKENAADALSGYLLDVMIKKMQEEADGFYDDVLVKGNVTASPDEIKEVLQRMTDRIRTEVAAGNYVDDLGFVVPLPKTHEDVINAIDWSDLDLSNPAGLAFRNYTLANETIDQYGMVAVFERIKGGRYIDVYADCKECVKNAMFADADLPWGGPDHSFSPRCQSGKRPHCTCDTCF